MAAISQAAPPGGVVTQLPLYQVDAFTAKPFSGNPAAVCLLPKGLSMADTVRQKIAAEMNLAETAFVQPLEDSTSADPFKQDSRFILRWFTPTVEVPMCGHATLASAAALFEEAGNVNKQVDFSTASGILSVTKAGDLLRMSLPLADISHTPPDWVSPDCDMVKICTGGLPAQAIHFTESYGLKYLLVALPEGTSREQLEAIKPDFSALERAGNVDDVHGVIVTTAGGAGSGYNLLSRFYAPWMGIPEDPVTGSAHSVLGPYWAQRLGRPTLKARQCSGRGGELQLTVDPQNDRVEVAGQAVVVLAGMLRL